MTDAPFEYFDALDGFAEPSQPFIAQPARGVSDKRDRLRLIRSRQVGPITYRRLLAEHGTAQRALEALPQVAHKAGLKGYEIAPEAVVDAEIEAARAAGARLLCLGDPEYPATLAQIADAPPALWAVGARGLLERPMVAMVGTRNASSLGARMAKRIALDLGAAQVVTVSGLARGIDAVVHDASLEAGTIAVVAGGLDVVYPPENERLMAQIRETGLILSEAPMGTHPHARDFPKRNRIISGLSLATVVVEAAQRSGSMITARDALDQGREVLAVPGHPLDGRASGCNQLLREGARLVQSAQDILDALPCAPKRTEAPPVQRDLPGFSPIDIEAEILGILGQMDSSEADLMRALGLPQAKVVAALGNLEISGRLIRDAGGKIRLCDPAEVAAH